MNDLEKKEEKMLHAIIDGGDAMPEVTHLMDFL